MSKLFDLTHTFTEDMPVYPGDPCVKFYQIATLEEDGFNDRKIESGLHVGTHMDAPLHMLAGGKYISELSLSKFSGWGHLIDVRGRPKIEADVLSDRAIERGDILLFFTGLSQKFRDPEYFTIHPELSVTLAKEIVSLGINIVGLDFPSPDRPPFLIHKILLGNGVLIIENLTNLEQLLQIDRFRVMAYPIKFQAGGAPVRVIAESF
ncbi:MAG: cyclase family protein [Cyanobacteria bacterium P01_E01_bin.42]